jgi:hypothetical protein
MEAWLRFKAAYQRSDGWLPAYRPSLRWQQALRLVQDFRGKITLAR